MFKYQDKHYLVTVHLGLFIFQSTRNQYVRIILVLALYISQVYFSCSGVNTFTWLLFLNIIAALIQESGFIVLKVERHNQRLVSGCYSKGCVYYQGLLCHGYVFFYKAKDWWLGIIEVHLSTCHRDRDLVYCLLGLNRNKFLIGALTMIVLVMVYNGCIIQVSNVL